MNCSKYDCDEDGVNDGQEINGYQVTISWYEGENLKSKDITVYGDPMGAYKDPNGNYLDVDGDGIYDIDEIDPKNSTRVNWYINELERDEYDGIITEEEKEEHITFQFNPYIKETIPPKIENIDIKTSVKIKWKTHLFVPYPVVKHCWSKIKVEISDVSEFTVTIKVKDNGKYETFTGKGNEEFEATIDIDYWKDYLLDYEVQVIATDVAGNELEWEKEVNGVFGGLLDFLTAIWDVIAGAFTAAFELMMAALSFLVDLIMGKIQEAFDAVFSPIQNAIDNWISELYTVFDRIIVMGDTDSIDVNLLSNTLIGGAFVSILAAVAFLILYFIEPLLFIIANILPGTGPVTSLISEAFLEKAAEAAIGSGSFACAVAVSTPLVMIGEIIATFIPNGGWFEQITSAVGTFFVSLLALSIQKKISGGGLNQRDSIGLTLMFAGFIISIFQARFLELAKFAAITGAIIAVIGLIFSLSSPDLPFKPIGFIDEGLGSILTGIAIYNAVYS